MLVDVNTTRSRKLQTGVYLSTWWNFELEFRGHQRAVAEDWPDLGGFSCHGVCDSPEQLLARLPAEVTAPGRDYVVSVVRLDKADQPPSGGWRWHMWGPYTGTQTPTCEHLYDEPVIETVYTYHVYKV
jgi:hypothetical protein